MASSTAAPLFLLLLAFSSRSTDTAHAAEVLHDDGLNYIAVATSSLKAKAVCEGLRVNTSSAALTDWVPVSRRHGPCSAAAAAGNNAGEPPLLEMLRWDQHRADYIQSMLSRVPGVKDSMLPPPAPTTQSTMSMDGTDPTITPKTGTPPQPTQSTMASHQLSIDPAAASAAGGGGQTMVIDTGSVLPWLQCAPCPVPPCHPQTDPLYDPAKSTTSATFSCGSPECRQLGPFYNGCVNNQCQYRVQYPDGSSTMGTYVSDVIRLAPTRVLPRFQFGCSHAVQGHFSSEIAGTMGLGRGAQSLVSQGKGSFGDAFSYCIPPTASTTGFFLLGVPGVSASRYAVTPMVQHQIAPSLYLVRLRAVTVAGQRLDLPPPAFAAGAVIDSRTPFTRLPPTTYQALRDAFRNAMRMYRAVAPIGQLDTCYDFTGVTTITLPKIALVFDRNAVVELDPSGILFKGCLAFTAAADDRDTGMIGNVQQRTIEVFYDVGGGAMAFRRGAC